MRNLDPDNDIMRVTGASGSYGATGGITYTTRNCILGQKKQGDAFTGVSATSVVGTDSFFGMFSWDERSAVAHGGFHNYNPYNTAFDTMASGNCRDADQAIDLQFTLGDMAAGQRETVEFFWLFDKDESPDCMPNAGAPVNKNAGVSGDPFVVGPQGDKVQFFLPLHQEVQLLQCKDLQLFGTAFGSTIPGDHQQWFDKFRIVVDGTEELVVQIQKNATEVRDDADINAGRKDSVELTTIKVDVEGNAMKRAGAIGTEGGSLIAVWHTESVETVQFSLGSMVLQLKSAVAQKFNEKQQQQLYTHLDMRFVELQTKECSKGVLAEIWGVIAMSADTAKMLEPPKH
jgi:hypothetical protein